MPTNVSPPLYATPTYLGSTVTAAPPLAVAAPAMPSDAWSPQAGYPLGSPPPLQGVWLTFDQLIDRLDSMAHQGAGLIGQFCQAVSHLLSGSSPPPGGKPPRSNGPTRFVLSSFNVLSSSAGKGKGYAPGPQRMHDVARILQANQVSVVGLQEMAHDQLVEFRKVAGNEYGTYAGSSGKRDYHDTTLAWRKDSWKLVKGDHLAVPSYGGITSQVPFVLLENRQTGQQAYFIDAHNPANTRHYHHQEAYRDAAARKEAALAKQLLEQTGLPVFVMGDMNSVGEAQAIFTQGAPLQAANPSRQSGIDWIFGSKDVTFTGFRRQRDADIAKTTDHPVVFTDVRITGKRR